MTQRHRLRGLPGARELAREQPAKNVFISPYSISTVLQMVGNGAEGSTRDEMARVLGTAGLEARALNQAHKDLDEAVRSAQGDVELRVANALWYSVAVQLKPACLPEPRFLCCHTRPTGLH